MLEALESRTFLSATASPASLDLKALHLQDAVVTTDIKAWTKTEASDYKLIAADLKRLKLQKTDKSLLSTYSKDGSTAFSKLSSNNSHDVGTVYSDASALVTASAKAAKSPTNTKLAATVTADQTKLTAAVTAALTALDADTASMVTTITADVTAIGTVTSSDTETQTDISTATTALTTNSATVDAQVSIVSADVSTILTALSL